MPIGFSLTLLFSVRLTRVLLPTTRSRKDKYQPDQVVCLSCTVGLVITGKLKLEGIVVKGYPAAYGSYSGRNLIMMKHDLDDHSIILICNSCKGMALWTWLQNEFIYVLYGGMVSLSELAA